MMGLKVLLGVSGGIAAYKSAEIVRALIKRGDEVRVVMTAGAQEFITPLTLQVLSGNPVGTHTFDATYESDIGHIELARWADVVLVAPATANFIARLSAGMADDLLTTVLLASEAPVVVAPAMNTQMYRHPFVQRNIEALASHPNYHLVEPDAGELACKEVGPGRLPDPHVLLQAIDAATSPAIMDGMRVLISAGPTREFIDPARFISNPSTGKMGYALAHVARRFGSQVTLVSGPTTLAPPYGVEFVGVTSAREMHAEVTSRAPEADFVVMAAAVADWRPASPSASKVTKSKMDPSLTMERNPDILAELGELFGHGKGGAQTKQPLLIGFAAESEDVEARGQAKMRRKNAHMMVANKIGGPKSAFGADFSEIFILHGDQSHPVGPDTKEALATSIWKRALRLRTKTLAPGNG